MAPARSPSHLEFHHAVAAADFGERDIFARSSDSGGTCWVCQGDAKEKMREAFRAPCPDSVVSAQNDDVKILG